MFCVGWSYGSALPGSAGTVPNPYTPDARGHELKAEMSRIGCEIRFLMAGSGVLGAQGVGGIRGDTARAEFLDFQSGNEAVVNTESGRR